MSVSVLLDDRIDEIFKENKSLEELKCDRFNLAIAHLCNQKILNEINFDELMDGIVDGSGDRAMDMIYIYDHNSALNDKDDYVVKKNSEINIKIFQNKATKSFGDTEFLKVKRGVEELFKLDLDLNNVSANHKIKEKAKFIRNIVREAAKKGCPISCDIFYCTKSSEECQNKTIDQYNKELKEYFKKLSITNQCHFWGAQELLKLSKEQNEEVELTFLSTPITTQDKGVDTYGYSGFVNGNSLIEALLDENENFRDYLTEGNVRFFLGEKKEINADIISTAKDTIQANYFWAMNNGLTIIADEINSFGNEYRITNPKIVNGCQTIHCLYNAYSHSNNRLPNNLKVFVKIIYAENETIQSQIIKATNSQNAIKTTDYKANDDIQKNIEDVLLKEEIFYERRRNYYKRKGKTGTNLISIELMVQILHTIKSKKSIEAINDLSKIVNSHYDDLFSTQYDYDFYKYATKLYTKVWTFKNSYMRNLSTNEEADKRRILGRSLFPLVSIMSSLIINEKTFKNIDLISNNNTFKKNKARTLKRLDNNDKMQDYFNQSVTIFLSAVQIFSDNNLDKNKIDLFKDRKFDELYISKAYENFHVEEAMTA